MWQWANATGRLWPMEAVEHRPPLTPPLLCARREKKRKRKKRKREEGKKRKREKEKRKKGEKEKKEKKREKEKEAVEHRPPLTPPLLCALALCHPYSSTR